MKLITSRRKKKNPLKTVAFSNFYESQNTTHFKPLVNTFGVELVITGENSEELAGLEVTHTNDTSAVKKKLKLN